MESTWANYNVSHLCSANFTLALTWKSFINQDNKQQQDSATDSSPNYCLYRISLQTPKTTVSLQYISTVWCLL